MSRKTKLILWFWLGIVLALAPILGTLPTVIGMVTAFGRLNQPAQPAMLDQSVRLGLLLTMAGLLACPIGIVIAVVAAIRLRS